MFRPGAFLTDVANITAPPAPRGVVMPLPSAAPAPFAATPAAPALPAKPAPRPEQANRAPRVNGPVVLSDVTGWDISGHLPDPQHLGINRSLN